jgi:hypothetical protein
MPVLACFFDNLQSLGILSYGESKNRAEFALKTSKVTKLNYFN